MAGSDKKSVEISLKLTGAEQISSSIDSLSENFTELSKSVEAASDSLYELKTALSQFKIPKELDQVVTSFRKLSKVKISSEFTKGLNELGKVAENAPDLSKFSEQLSKFSKIKLPSVLQFANGLDKLSKSIEKVRPASTVLSNFYKSVELYDKIKVPNILQIAIAIQKLGESSLNAARASSRLQLFYSNISLFNGIKLPKITSFVQGFQELATLDIGAVVSKIAQLNVAIKRLDQAGKLKNFNDFARNLDNISKNLLKSQQSFNKATSSLSLFNKNINEGGRSIQTFGDKVRSYLQYRIIADGVMAMQQAMRSGAVAIVEYDQSLKDLQAITGATSFEVEQMSEKIREVASSTKFSASEVAEGMRIIGQAGFTAKEAIDAMEAVSNLATGTLSSMEASVQIVTTALRVFSIDAAESTRVSDVFANAINRSKLTVEGLKTSFQYIGPVAASAGVSFEESAASMMVLANSGLSFSKIGTGLRRVLSELISPTKGFKKAIEESGLSISDFDTRVKPFTEVINNLRMVVTDSKVAFEAFGKRGAAAVLSLTSKNSNFEQLLDTVGETGTAAKMASTQMEGLGVMFKNLQDKLSLLAVSIGDAGISDSFRILIKLGRTLTDVLIALIDNPISRFIGKGLILTSTIIGVTTAWKIWNLAVTSGALQSYVQRIPFAIAGFKGLQTAINSAKLSVLSFIKTPLGLTLIGITTALSSLVWLWNSYIDGALKSAEITRKSVDEYIKLETALNNYKNKISELKEGSKEYKETNLELRKSLLEVAESDLRLSNSALLAAESINVLDGSVKGNYESLNELKTLIDTIKFEDIAKASEEASESLYKQNIRLNTYVNSVKDIWTDFSKNIGVFGEYASTLFGILDDGADRSFSNLGVHSAKFSENMKLAGDMTKRFNDVNDPITYKEMAEYLQYMSQNTKYLTAQQKDQFESLKLIKNIANEAYNELVKSGRVNLDMTTDQVSEIAKSLKIGGESLTFLLGNFEKLKESSESNFNSIFDKWEESTESLGGTISELIPKYKELTGIDLSAQKDSISILEKKQELLKQEKDNIEKNYQEALARGENEVEATIKYNKEKYEHRKNLTKLIKELSENEAYQSIQFLLEANKKYKEEDEKLTDEYKKSAKERLITDQEIANRRFAIWAQFQEKIESSQKGSLDGQKLVNSTNTYVKSLESIYSSFYIALENLKVEGQVSEEKYNKRKLELNEEVAKKTVELWKNTEEKIRKLGDTSSTEYRDALNKKLSTEKKLSEVILKNKQEELKNYLAMLERQYSEEESIIDSHQAKILAKISENEANKVITHEQANQQKIAADLLYYAESVRMAEEHLSKIDKSSSPEAYASQLEEVLQREEKFYQERAKLIDSYNEKINSSQEKIEENIEKREKSEKLQAKNLKNITKHLYSDIENYSQDYLDDLLNYKEKHTDESIDLDYDLAKEIVEINEDLADDLKDIQDDIAENKRKLSAELLDIESEHADAEREIRQRDMTDRQKSIDDEKFLKKEMADLEKEYRKAKNAGSIEEMQAISDRMGALLDVAKGLEDESDALAWNNKLLKERKEIEEQINKVENEELAAKAVEAATKAEEQRKQAINDALAAEDTRHDKVVNAVTQEITKYQELIEKLQEASEVAQSITLDGISTDNDNIQSTVNAVKDIGLAFSENAQKHSQSTAQINSNNESIIDGYRKIEENGKTVYTNLTDAQRESFTMIAEAMKGSFDGAFDGLQQSGNDSIKVIQDSFSNLKAVMSEEISVIVNTSELNTAKEEIDSISKTEAEVTVTANTENIDQATEKVKGISNTEANVLINVDNSQIDDSIKKILTISESNPELFIKVDSKEVNQLIKSVAELENISIKIEATVSGIDDLKDLITLISEVKDKSVDVEADVEGESEVNKLQTAINNLVGKTVTVDVNISSAMSKIRQLQNALNSIKAPTIKLSTGGAVAGYNLGGYVPQFFNDGGNVFRKLPNRYISSGSGHKDDVPAMLMKGEFVHRTAAVRKYGKKFMEMVNAGLYPIELAKKAIGQYANGGIVDFVQTAFSQNFASGGMVLGSLKKRLLELLGTNSGLNIDNINFVNNIQQKAEGITTELGHKSINELSSTVSNAIAEFSSGGDVSNTLADLQAQKVSIKKAYNEEIAAAKASGKEEIASILTQEREDIAKIMQETEEELIQLKQDYMNRVQERNEEYQQAKKERTEEHREEAQKLKEEYGIDLSEIETDYQEKVADDNYDHEKEIEEKQKKEAEAQKEYAEKVVEIKEKAEAERQKILEDFNKARDDVDEKISNVHDFAEYVEDLFNEYNSKIFKSDGTSLRKDWDPVDKWDSSLLPDYEKLRQLIFVTYNPHKPETRDKNMEEFEALWEEFSTAQRALNEHGIPESSIFSKEFGPFNFKNRPHYKDFLDQVKISPDIDYKDFLNEFSSQAITLDVKGKIADLDKDFNDDYLEREEKWKEYLAEKARDDAERDLEYKNEKADLLSTYNNNSRNNYTSYREDLSEYKKDLDTNLFDYKTDYDETFKEVNQNSANSIKDIKSKATEDVNNVKLNLAKKLSEIDAGYKKDYADLLKAMNEAKTTKSSVSSSVSDDSEIESQKTIAAGVSSAVNKMAVEGIRFEKMSVEELLRKLGFPGGFRFNTGGQVPHTQFSIPGKDSIMAALTPGEYVIREPVVKMLGSGFFESLNNFKIPKFNSGGIVGSIQNNIKESNTLGMIKHQLDLTINEKPQEPLYGSKIGIEALINDLNLAKLRSQ